MDPNFDKMTGFNLPQPVEAAPPMPAPEVHNVAATPEVGGTNQLGGYSMTASTIAPSTPATVPLPNVASSQAVGGGSLTVSPPAVADDNDLIEKEWVNKAKEIVEKTKEDPYTQSKELTKFKSDYMLKRYNKELKLSE